MIDKYERFLKQIIVKAGKATLKYYGKKNLAYTKLNINDPVTKADLASNKIITNAIKKNFPNHGIITEEEKDYKSESEYVWIVDPLDGTLNYSKSIPLYGVMIALAKNREVVIAGIYLPFFKNLYYARIGMGAYKDGKRIHCSKRTDIKHTCGICGIVTGKGYRPKMISLINAENDLDLWFTELGALAVDAVLVAEGKKDWYICPFVWGGIWDYAAPALILKESGCKTTDLDGNTWNLKKKDISIVAANSDLHKQLLRIMKVKK